MPGIGFKIADGYVEVHAFYDKAGLQKAAADAADDFGERFGRDASAESTKAFKKDWQKNFQDNFIKDRQVTTRVAQRMVHALIDEMNYETDRSQSRIAAIGTRIGTRLGNGVKRALHQINWVDTNLKRRLEKHFAQQGDGAASSFLKRFIEVVTLGQADLPRANPRSGFAAKMAKFGTGLGVVAAGAMIGHIGNAVTALLPIALGGALLAIPIADLIARNVDLEKGKLSFSKNAMGQALKDFIRTAQSLADRLGKAFGPTMLRGLRDAVTLFKALEKPMANAVKAISPGALAMWRGLLGAVASFGKAMGPAMAGINIGLKQWGVELPKIGKALGEAFSTILKNPELVRKAVMGLSNLIQGILKVAAGLVTFLTYVMAAINSVWRVANMGENILAKFLGYPAALQRIAQAFGPLKTAILAAWEAFKKFATATTDEQATTRLRTLVEKIKAIWRPLKTFLGEVWKAAWAKIKDLWNTYVVPWINNTLKPWLEKKLKEIGRTAFEMLKDAAKAELKKLPGMAETELKKLIDKIKQKLKDAVEQAKDKAKELVDRVITKLKELPGKAASAIASMPGKIKSKIAEAVTAAKAKAKELVDGFIRKLKELPGKAAAVASDVKSRIVAKFSGAGSWLVSAGKSIIDGLASGIRSAAGRAADAAASAAKAALAAAKRALGISSPSKVFAEQVGKPIAQGIGVGMRRNIKDEFKELPGMLPQMSRARGSAGGGSSSSRTSTFNPTINVHVAAGLDPVDGAARRALVKGLYLETEKFRKDYVR
jgi:phage-related protein